MGFPCSSTESICFFLLQLCRVSPIVVLFLPVYMYICMSLPKGMPLTVGPQPTHFLRRPASLHGK